MLAWSLLSTIVALVSFLPSVRAGVVASNHTAAPLEARGSTWATAKCANVAGTYQGYKYNFGCLCDDDLDDFCTNNNINPYIKSLLSYYVSRTSPLRQTITANTRADLSLDPTKGLLFPVPRQCSTQL